MGTGNWSLRGGVTVCLEEDTDEPFWYEDLLDSLGSCLSVAWEPVKDKWVDNNSKVQFQSKLHRIVSHGDSYGHLFLCFIARDDLERPELATPHTEKWAQTVFDKLQKHYPDMTVATSAWTSAPRQTQEERISNAVQ